MDTNRYLGNKDQIVGVRRVALEEGNAKGCAVLEVRSGAGLAFDVLVDTGMDIGMLSYRGVNISYLSKNGYDSPSRIMPYENEFSHTFPGGMLYTCGLRSTGPANRDGDEWHPVHGRYHGLSAVNVGAAVEKDEIVITGAVSETMLFGTVLKLKRRIRVPLMRNTVIIEDSIQNLTPNNEEFMLLYHFNFGYPMLNESAVLILPDDRRTTMRDGNVWQAPGAELRFALPADSEPEQVYFHVMKDATATLSNKDAGISATLKWSGDTLPILAQWRSLATGDYALGLEPTNSYIKGRSAERANGTLPVIKGYQTVQTKLELSFQSSL